MISHTNEVVTAREFPRLLGVEVSVDADGIKLSEAGQLLRFDADTSTQTNPFQISFFSEHLNAVEVSTEISDWFSRYLGFSCRLISIDPASQRRVLERRGGVRGDHMALADECPLLIISEASLQDLNDRMDVSVPMSQFRPNIVISNSEPYAEDELGRFAIGDVVFEVTQRCKRCDLATIDPSSFEKSKLQEPLRTLAKYRRQRSVDGKGGVTFGAHAIPRSTGEISVGMELTARLSS